MILLLIGLLIVNETIRTIPSPTLLLQIMSPISVFKTRMYEKQTNFSDKIEKNGLVCADFEHIDSHTMWWIVNILIMSRAQYTVVTSFAFNSHAIYFTFNADLPVGNSHHYREYYRQIYVRLNKPKYNRELLTPLTTDFC